ncbi:hypothetical protein LCGC14_1796150 [marine sediment metagenome]|uniref:Uncharacterized protein n=1 Tax=marine sediment metagenome TaxID=412755 RepID=A0A0F9JQP9_9ZZZZ
METCFADTPRIKDKPFSKRIGNNLLERSSEGSVRCHYGFFSPSQILARKVLSDRIFKEIKSKMYFSRFVEETK